jgi:cytochrome b6
MRQWCKRLSKNNFEPVQGEHKMPDEKSPNGKNGKSVGLVERVTTGVKDDLESLKTDLPAKAKEQIEILSKPTKTQVFTSIFRHKHDDTPRNRALGVLSNVFLHLHPAKINRDAVRYSYTWGMGGITFYLFIVLTLTGVMLMFYYHPSKVQAFRDVLYLEHDVPFGKLLRNMHRWAAHLMVIAVELHMFRVFLTGSYKKPREFNWNVGVILLVLTLLLSFTGYLLPDDQLGFWAVTVGTNMARATPGLGNEGPFAPSFITPYNDVRFGLLGGSIVDANALLRSYIWHCIGIPIIASIFMILHFWRVRKDGGISGPAAVVLDSEVKEAKK